MSLIEQVHFLVLYNLNRKFQKEVSTAMATTYEKILENHLKVNNGAVVTIFRLSPVILSLIEFYNVDEINKKRKLKYLGLETKF